MYTHAQSSTVDSLLLCQGISHDQSQSFVSPGVKKVKTERRRRLEGNVVGFGAYKLFAAEQKCSMALQNCSRNTYSDPATCSNSLSYWLSITFGATSAWECRAITSDRRSFVVLRHRDKMRQGDAGGHSFLSLIHM